MRVAPRFRALTDPRDISYRPNYEFPGEFIDEDHRAAAGLVADVEGWLVDDDASKLYELAYFTTGPVLEIGSYHGKSSIVMSRAIQNAGSGASIVSIDIDASALERARLNATRLGAASTVRYIQGTAEQLHDEIGDMAPALTFVDANHTYEGARQDAITIERLVPVGGIVVFHDYLSEEWAGQNIPDWYRVRQAVDDSWVPSDCEFAGISGGCGVFARVRT